MNGTFYWLTGNDTNPFGLDDLRSKWGEDPKVANLPIPALARPEIRVVVYFYHIIMLVGIMGNSATLRVLFQTYWWLRRRKSRTRLQFDNNSQLVVLYLICLSTVDLIVCICLVPTTSHMTTGYWLFGNFLCKVYWVLEASGKVVSSFLLAAVSYDRCIKVCKPHSSLQLKDDRSVVIGLLIVTSLGFALLSPLGVSAGQEDEWKWSDDKRAMLQDRSCVLNRSDNHNMLTIFALYIFAVGFIVPATIIVVSQIALIRKLMKHTEDLQVVRSLIPIRRIAIYTSLLLAWYLICFVPFWAGVLFTHFYGESLPETQFVVIAMYTIHALPYMSSAFNWFFYSCLNCQLRRFRRQFNDAKSLLLSTDLNNETFL